jgi:hypothetical protein
MTHARTLIVVLGIAALLLGLGKAVGSAEYHRSSVEMVI